VNGSTFDIRKKMKFKKIFKNKSKMTTENTEKDQELDDVTLEMNANGEQLIVEELPLEEQLAQDLAKKKINF
jgi:molecular chaperone GrpE